MPEVIRFSLACSSPGCHFFHNYDWQTVALSSAIKHADETGHNELMLTDRWYGSNRKAVVDKEKLRLLPTAE